MDTEDITSGYRPTQWNAFPDRSYPSCYKHGNELENDLFGQTAIRHRGDARGWVNNSTLGAAPVVTEAVEN